MADKLMKWIVNTATVYIFIQFLVPVPAESQQNYRNETLGSKIFNTTASNARLRPRVRRFMGFGGSPKVFGGSPKVFGGSPMVFGGIPKTNQGKVGYIRPPFGMYRNPFLNSPTFTPSVLDKSPYTNGNSKQKPPKNVGIIPTVSHAPTFKNSSGTSVGIKSPLATKIIDNAKHKLFPSQQTSSNEERTPKVEIGKTNTADNIYIKNKSKSITKITNSGTNNIKVVNSNIPSPESPEDKQPIATEKSNGISLGNTNRPKQSVTQKPSRTSLKLQPVGLYGLQKALKPFGKTKPSSFPKYFMGYHPAMHRPPNYLMNQTAFSNNQQGKSKEKGMSKSTEEDKDDAIQKTDTKKGAGIGLDPAISVMTTSTSRVRRFGLPPGFLQKAHHPFGGNSMGGHPFQGFQRKTKNPFAFKLPPTKKPLVITAPKMFPTHTKKHTPREAAPADKKGPSTLLSTLQPKLKPTESAKPERKGNYKKWLEKQLSIICKFKPCKNGGKCIGKGVMYCVCENDYIGLKCEKHMPKCEDLFCVKHECVKHGHEILCACNATMCRRTIHPPTQQEKLEEFAKNENNLVIAASIAMVILFIAIAVYCIKVCAKRKVVHEKYRRLLKENVVPEDLPPDFLALSLCGGGDSIRKMDDQLEAELAAKKKKSKKKKKKKGKDSKKDKDEKEVDKSANCLETTFTSGLKSEEESFVDENFSACLDKYKWVSNKDGEYYNIHGYKKNKRRFVPRFLQQKKNNIQISQHRTLSNYNRNTNTNFKYRIGSPISNSSLPRKTSFWKRLLYKSPGQNLNWHIQNPKSFYDPLEVMRYMWSDAHVKKEVPRDNQSEDSKSTSDSGSDSEDVIYTRRDGTQ